MDLHELKQKLLYEKKLAAVYDFFLSHFGENLDFLALGEMAESSSLASLVEQIALQMYPQGGAINNMRLTRLADQHFIHGAFFMGSRIGGVFYFEDCHAGLVALTDLPPSFEVKYARFTSRFQAPSPSRN